MGTIWKHSYLLILSVDYSYIYAILYGLNGLIWGNIWETPLYQGGFECGIFQWISGQLFGNDSEPAHYLKRLTVNR